VSRLGSNDDTVRAYAFGSIDVDGVTYEHDLIVDVKRVRKRRKAPSKPFRSRFGHTPLSVAEDIPWEGRRQIIGTGGQRAAPCDGRGARKPRGERSSW
jgi:hypothetical protein